MGETATRRIRHLLLVLAILVAIAPLMAGHPWRSAIADSSIVPGSGLADVAIGAPISEVLNRFGTPSAVRLTGTDGLLGYGFDRYGITVYAHGDTVQAVATTNSVLGGLNGISLGASQSDVVRAMGADYTAGVIEGFAGIVYRGLGVAFGFDGGAVASILVFAAAGAAPAQPGSLTLASGPVTSQAPADSIAAGLAPAGAPAMTSAARPEASPTVPDISALKPYSGATHYLSLAGYLRLIVHSSSNTWITRDQGERLIEQADLPESRMVGLK